MFRLLLSWNWSLLNWAVSEALPFPSLRVLDCETYPRVAPTLGWHLGVAPGWARQGGGGRGRDQKAASCDPPLLPGRHRRFCWGRAGRPGTPVPFTHQPC